MLTIKFEPFQTTISPQFWSDLREYKLHHAKLLSDKLLIKGRFSPGRQIQLRSSNTSSTSQEKAQKPSTLKPRFNLEFILSAQRNLLSSTSQGTLEILDSLYKENSQDCTFGLLYNYNTIEEFKSIDRNALLKEYTALIYSHIKSKKQQTNPLVLSLFILTTFADLKRFKFYYWAAYPSIVETIPNSVAPNSSPNIASQTYPISSKFGPLGLLCLSKEYQEFSKSHPSDCLIFSLTYSSHSPDNISCFIDPSGSQTVAGWILRNILVWARSTFANQKISVLCYKDVNSFALFQPDSQSFPENSFQSILYEIPNDIQVSESYQSVGWERNLAGKLLPKLSSLEASMDPLMLASSSLDLNLQLMKWRLAPSLDLSVIASTKCLLLGSGTLGCNVARLLLGWGITDITFVDNGSVSYSNPPRQPLFNFSDVGKPKAICASENMKSIFPAINSNGIQLSIAMPGHHVAKQNEESVLADCEKLDSLIQSHDVIFLLTDSREGRWLPTVMGAVYKKLVICVALGFDSFVVMRHGPPHQESESPSILETTSHSDQTVSCPRLGCYFCNDIVAPLDSLSNRSLDQQCTVTRPGLAPISAGIAVELMTSILQHSKGIYADPVLPENYPKKSETLSSSNDNSQAVTSVLTYDKPIPHQIRGFLGDFQQHIVLGNSYDKCTACSDTIINAYKNRKINNFLLCAFNNIKQSAPEGEIKVDSQELEDEANFNYLEWLTGLSELHRKTDMLDVDDFLVSSDSDSSEIKDIGAESDGKDDAFNF
ncbi:hypothetical protein BB560_000714 [Smittium megazygosporum]|uniref:Ubiquitin-like modifier-activating enzyme ATG7 n=1 Tax=Smittium megazygosporum TaxID=133381 RepID=A0A2T9ZJN7_9FUNG|nr:hypothetical protein BB560_000714 [Smittium megazygosporum]